MRKDLRELTGTLKDFQEKEFRMKQLDKKRVEQDQLLQIELERKLKECENERIKATEERKKAETLRTAFDADKQILQDRVNQLEAIIKAIEDEKKSTARKVGLMEQNDEVQRSELNYWNGKVTNMRRDLEF
jgi:hypothetical protein